MDVGDEVVIVLEGDGVRIMSLDQGVARARRLVGRYVKPARSLSRVVRRERRNEAKCDSTCGEGFSE
jgi:hypothetical protein